MSTEYVRKDINTSDVVDGTAVDVKNDVVITDQVAKKALVEDAIADDATARQSIPEKAPAAAQETTPVALITPEESDRLRARWLEIQGKFVDEPRPAVQQADALVSDVIKQLTQMFANEHTLLEGQWKQGKEVSTEDLRQALLRYHSFFKRLVV